MLNLLLLPALLLGQEDLRGPFEAVARLRVPEGNAEIVAAARDGTLLVFTNSSARSLGVVDLTEPEQPRWLPNVALGGAPTSVKVDGRWALATVFSDAARTGKSAPDFEPGRLAVVDLEAAGGPALTGTVDIGWHPDSLALTRVGGDLVAVLAIENEPVIAVDGKVVGGEAPGDPRDVGPAGLVQVVTLDPAHPEAARVVDVRLPQTTLALAGLLYPTDPQPEFVSISGLRAAVSLQENNGIAIIDLADPGAPELVHVFPLGVAAERPADLTEDGELRPTEGYPSSLGTKRPVPRDGGGNPVPGGLRFPDAIAFSPDGTLIYSADEGELDFTGGRGWSVWSTAGELVWQDGGELEEAAIRAGLYPDNRSENKGIEVEGVATARFGEASYAFVVSERASFAAVYDVTDARNPRLRQVLPTGVSPEGVLALPARGLFVTADEVGGTLSVFRLVTRGTR